MLCLNLYSVGEKMKTVVTPEIVDLKYRIIFAEPQLDLIREERRIPLIKKIIESFGLSINNIKFNDASPSNDWIHFSKLDNPTFLNVSFGLEQVEAWLQRPQKEEQVLANYGKLALLLKDIKFASQTMMIQWHLKVDGDNLTYLKSLSPNIPENFKEFFHGSGVSYTLKIPEHNLTIFVTVVESLYTENGLFLSIENEFSPNKYSFDESLKIARHFHDIILEGVGLEFRAQEG